MWNHRICGSNCPGSRLTCFKVLMRERRELGCYMKDVSWSQHIQADNKPGAKSVKSQSTLFRETSTTSNVRRERLALHQGAATSPGNDALALWLIWSLVQFILKEGKRRKGTFGSYWRRVKEWAFWSRLQPFQNTLRVGLIFYAERCRSLHYP